MIADIAHLVLLIGKILIIGSSAGLGAVFLSGWAWNTLEARRLRRRAQVNHENRRRTERILAAQRRSEGSRVIPSGERGHPLYSIGGSCDADHALTRRFR